ncbi:MAG TPA: PAS domain S-box protein [Bacteroidales bacterium]|nr:PAS domain S-box protein [Bacteroidales bacterium]
MKKTHEFDASKFVSEVIFRNSLDAIVISDLKGRSLACNKAACDLLGYSEQEIVGLGRDAIVEMNSLMIKNLISRRESGSVSAGITLKRKDGSRVSAQATSTLFSDEQGKQLALQVIRDISESIRLDREITEVREFTDRIIDTANLIFIQLDHEGNILRVNKTFEKITGYASNEVIGTSWFDKLVPIDRYPRVWEEFQRNIDNFMTSSTFVNPILTKAGVERNIRWQYSHISDRKGKMMSVAFGLDTTDQERNSQDLKQANLLLKEILSSAPITIFAVDRNGLFSLSDGKELRLVGLKPGENVGISASSLYNDMQYTLTDGSSITGKELMRRVSSGETITAVNQFKGIVFENHIGPIEDDSGTVDGIVGVAVNITERVGTQRLLQEKEVNLRSIIENVKSSVVLIDREFKIIECNSVFRSRFKKLTGTDIEKGQLILNGLQQEQKEFWRKIYNKGLSGAAFTFNKSILEYHRRGMYRFALNPVLSENGTVIGLAVVSEDISGQIRNENRLKSSTRKLKSLNNRIRDIIDKERTRIAHDLHDDLGQKLTAINLNLAWMRNRLGVQSELVADKFGEIVKMVGETIDSTRRLSHGLRPDILDNLGLISTIEWQLKDFSKNTGVKAVFRSNISDTSANKRISLDVFRVIQEALTNISKHAGATTARLTITETKRLLKISIKDDGHGFSVKDAEKSESLGLAGIRERIEMNEGTLKIESRKGSGTLIAFQIPLKKSVSDLKKLQND